MSEHTANAATGMTAEELIQSLTGFDEIAIERMFDGFDIYKDGKDKGVRALRALAFIVYRRDGLNDREAFQAAQNLGFSEVSGLFLPEDDELDPDNPDGELGKDSAPLG